MEWVYAGFAGLLAIPVALSGLAFLLLLWDKPFVILASVWAAATVTMLVFAPTDGAKITAGAVGMALAVAWFTSSWWRGPMRSVWRAIQHHARHLYVRHHHARH